MNSADDYSSPAAPYSGDGAFAEHDMVSTSPTTSERVVDTQSGFLVVIRRADATRLELSVKRRLGTPPSSFVLLTPDESVKLSKILAEARSGQFAQAGLAERVSPRVDRWMSGLSKKTRVYQDLQDDFADQPEGSPEEEFARVAREHAIDSDLEVPARGKTFGLSQSKIAAIVAAAVIVPVFTWLMVSALAPKHDRQQGAQIAAAALEESRIDRFVRNYVADMLDFNPATYRASQIHAMAVMSPTLLERYWKETNFPLSAAQLENTPKGQTLIITKVAQSDAGNQTKEIDLFGELASTNSKISTPVHLKILVGYAPENQLRVLEQKDLSNGK